MIEIFRKRRCKCFVLPKGSPIIKILALYRLATISQITELHFSSKQVAWRRINDLVDFGLLKHLKNRIGQYRGRPERIIAIENKGLELLHSKKQIPSSITYEQVRGDNISSIEHQLLSNWFQIYTTQFEKLFHSLGVNFISSSSPLSYIPYGLSGIHEKVDIPTTESNIKFIPDAIFSISDNQKSLLFFLEIDMGTEVLASPKRNSLDIRQKIVNYQNYFLHKSYKRYENIFKKKFKGFRLLLMSNSHFRMHNLCNIVKKCNLPTLYG